MLPSDIGYYTIDEAIITDYKKSGKGFDISNYIVNFSFTESIHSAVLRGSFLITDSSNIVDNFPLRGEEIITLTYGDYFDNKITQDFFLFAVDSMGVDTQQNSTTYRLSFVSPQALMSSSVDVQKSYHGTTTEMINKIFQEYLVEQQRFTNARYTIDTEETAGPQTIVIPMLSPLDAINFLKRRSYSPQNKSSNYYFFQNRKQFRMVTHEKILKDAQRGRNFDPTKIFTHDPGLAIDRLTQSAGMNNILSIAFPKRYNTMDEIIYGGMSSKTVEVDILLKQYLFHPYYFSENVYLYQHTDQNPGFLHTDTFINKYFNGEKNTVVSNYIMTDVDGERKNQHYVDITAQRRSTSYFLNSFMCEMEIFGRNDLFAGDVVRLNLPQYEVVEGEKTQHQSLSGYWIVNQIQHNFTSEGKEYKCNVRLTKDLPREPESNYV